MKTGKRPFPDDLWIGVEHEYEVLEGDVSKPFGGMVHGLSIDGQRLDPGDPNAYRCSWGGVITVDGNEAEVVTPPVPLIPGFSMETEAIAATGGRALAAALPQRLSLRGYSTHVNVTVQADDAWAHARRFARRFAVPMMLLLDNRHSPGLLIRPRPSRLELGGDFVSGAQLRAALVMAAGGVLATARESLLPLHEPPRLGGKRERARIRPGLFISRTAFGPDLYEWGRNTPLGRRRQTAQVYLAHAAEAAIHALGDCVNQADIAALESVVSGAVPLPSESVLEGVPTACKVDQSHSPFASVILPRRRPQFALDCIVATWAVTVFRLVGARQAFVGVQRRSLAPFLEAIDSGALDAQVTGLLAARSQNRVLASAKDIEGVEFFDDLAPDADLVAKEPRPPWNAGGSGGSNARSDKQQTADQPLPLEIARPWWRRPNLFVAATAALLAIAVILFAVTNASNNDLAGDTDGALAAPVEQPGGTLGPEAGEAFAGDSEASLEFNQGVFTMSATMNLLSSSARPGETVNLVYTVVSNGPSTAIDNATGIAIIDCDPLPMPGIPPGRMDVAFLPVEDFPRGATLDDAVAQVYELILPEGGTAAEGTISSEPFERMSTGSCETQIATGGEGEFVVPELPAGEYWIVVPQNAITRPSPGEASGQHSSPVPTRADAPLLRIVP